MNARESELVKRVKELLGKDTKEMDFLEIIAELVEVAETQKNMMKLFIMEEN